MQALTPASNQNIMAWPWQDWDMPVENAYCSINERTHTLHCIALHWHTACAAIAHSSCGKEVKATHSHWLKVECWCERWIFVRPRSPLPHMLWPCRWIKRIAKHVENDKWRKYIMISLKSKDLHLCAEERAQWRISFEASSWINSNVEKINQRIYIFIYHPITTIGYRSKPIIN